MVGPGDPRRLAALRATANSLGVDAITGEVVTALRAAGVEAILLKGPVLAEWLYDGDVRPYVDVDLMVAPRQLADAERVLEDLGFLARADGTEGEELRHAQVWIRNGDAGAVDLHRALSGVALAPSEAWAIVHRMTETMSVGGAMVRVPSPGLRTLLVAAHAAQHGPEIQPPLDDLARALDRVPLETWIAATELAAKLEALPALARGLRLLPAGAELARKLGLPSAELIERATRRGSHGRIALGLQRLGERRSARDKLALLARELVPTPEFMRVWSPLARRGRLGLVASYPWRLLWLLWHTGPSLHALRRSRSETSAGH